MIKVINKPTIDWNTEVNIYQDARVNQYKDISISASETDDTLTIRIDFISGVPNIDSYFLEKTFYKNEFKGIVTSINVFKKKFESPYNLLVLTRKYNRVAAPMSTPVNSKSCDVGTLYISEDNTVWIVPRIRLSENSHKFDNCEYSEEVFGERTTQQVLFEHCPEAKIVADKWYIKKEALSDSIDVNSSISYLENQVDVLYKILNKIIEKTGIDVSEYQEILTEVERASSLNINTLTDVKDKINKNKGYIRGRQQAYYRMLREAGFDA